MPPSSDQGFIPRLREAINTTGNCLCVGIDPHVDKLPDFFAKELAEAGAEKYLERWGFALVDAAVGKVPAVKPQSAFFEAFGPPGFAALKSVMLRARAKGLLTVLDAKRGDMSSTMVAYGRMAFDEMQAHALTVTPYIGLDAVEALLPWLRKGAGVYVLWVSSNPGGGLLQELRLASGNIPLYEHLFGKLQTAFRENKVEAALGLVLGATKVDELSPALLAKLAEVSLLVPGVGAQGGSVTPKIQGLMNASRAVLVAQSRSLSEAEDGHLTWQKYMDNVESRIRGAASAVRL